MRPINDSIVVAGTNILNALQTELLLAVHPLMVIVIGLLFVALAQMRQAAVDLQLFRFNGHFDFYFTM